MTKYLTDERFIVHSNTKEAQQNYRDNYDRIFGNRESLYAEIRQSPERPPTVGQREDGSWYWLDETWGYGDDVHYETREAAQEAQGRYCREVLG